MPRARLSVRRSLAVTAAAVTLGATFYGVGAASADNSVPRSDKEIPNLSNVVSDIKAYYGDTVDAAGEHHASATSNYAEQLKGIESKAESYLAHAGRHSAKPAIVLDVDDTSLLTYNYELEVGFNYTPASNQAYLDNKNMEPVFGMDTLATGLRTTATRCSGSPAGPRRSARTPSATSPRSATPRPRTPRTCT